MRIWKTQSVIWEYENIYNPKCHLYDILGCTYSQMTFWVVPILIFSDDILGCAYCQMTLWVVYILIFSYYTLGIVIWEYVQPKMPDENMHNPKCLIRISTNQNVIWEYVQPKMSFENMHNPKCLIRISTLSPLIHSLRQSSTHTW
jgi:hypothetical protein